MTNVIRPGPGDAYVESIVDLDLLSLKEWLLLCRRAEERCRDRFRQIAGELGAVDGVLTKVVEALAQEEDQHVAAIQRFDDATPWPSVWHIDQTAVEAILATHFPRLSLGWAGLAAEPEAPAQFLMAVERECLAFYRMLAAKAAESRARTLFSAMAKESSEHLARLAGSMA